MMVAVLLSLSLAACSPAATPARPAPGVANSEAAPQPEGVAPKVITPDTTIPPGLATPAPTAQDARMQDPPAPTQPTQPASQLDPRLVGVWVNENQINSPGGAGGFASFSTVMTMELDADGTIRQFTQSVGGGGDWSSNAGRRLDFEGNWRASNNTLLVHGMGLPDYTPAATYSFSDQYLVTNSDMGRLVWQRRF
jgi:hypothetical protein